MTDAAPDLHLRLRHPNLDFWVDARLRRVGGARLAVADLAGTPEPAAAMSAELALFLSLWPLGPDIAADLVSGALLPQADPVRVSQRDRAGRRSVADEDAEDGPARGE